MLGVKDRQPAAEPVVKEAEIARPVDPTIERAAYRGEHCDDAGTGNRKRKRRRQNLRKTGNCGAGISSSQACG